MDSDLDFVSGCCVLDSDNGFWIPDMFWLWIIHSDSGLLALILDS